MANWVYGFGDGRAEGRAEMKNLLGGNGANLAEMSNLGLPVPPGFTITTEVCTYYYANERKYPGDLEAQVKEAWGTAVNVQAMVFGNMGDDCATGVAFTRDPSTGENIFYGEYLVNAQGEDVVAGIRTPQQLTLKGKQKQKSKMPAMEEVMPTVFRQLAEIQHCCEGSAE